MNFTGLFFLLLTQFLTGKGIIRLFKIQLQPIATLCFSMLIGVFMVSFVPCVIQLAHIPITAPNVYIGISVMTALFSVPLLLNIKNTKMPAMEWPQLYEVPFILVLLTLAVISCWRCFYFPVTPRDMLTGPELLAEFAVREKTMLSSVFTIDLRLEQPGANNVFKSPFITCLQIVYKLLVHPFGQEWLSVVFLSFTLWFYTILRKCIHPMLAGLVLMILYCCPDLFAYTYIILYDYSNMVFFFAGFYFLSEYLDTDRMPELLFASFLLGIATYVRNETLVIVGATILPLLAIYFFRKKTPIKKAGIAMGLVIALPVFFSFFCSFLVKKFVPFTLNLSPLLNHNLFDLSFFFERITDMFSKLMWAKKAEAVYANFFIIFFGLLVVDVVWPRKYNRQAQMALWGFFVVYIGLAVVGFLVPSTSIENTMKRGLFKLLPFMAWYMANSGIMQRISDFLKARELKATMPKETKPKPATVTAAKPNAVPKSVKGK
jgi:hypothetical protein